MEVMEDASTIEMMLIDKAKLNKTPINGSFELLPLCNFNCDMCYVHMSKESVNKKGGLLSLDHWLNIAREMKDQGVLFLLLTGGEPLLYPHFKELYLELRKMGMILTINTNGSLIDEKMAAFFGKYKPRRINITLYGSNNEVYENLCHYRNGFDKVMHTVELLQRQGVDVKYSCSLSPKNMCDIMNICDISNKQDIFMSIDTYMMPTTRENETAYNMENRVSAIDAARVRIEALKKIMSPEEFNQYVNEQIDSCYHMGEVEYDTNVSCLAGNCSFTINWQGNMRPCVVLSNPSISVLEHGFEKSWQYLVNEVSQIRINKKCGTCKKRPVCRTCAGSAMLETGSYDGIPEYMCEYAEESLRLLKNEKDI